ncbi:MAG: response regulator, partial [Thalassolituus sp.]
SLVPEVAERLKVQIKASRYHEPLDFVITDAPPSSTEASDNTIYIVDRYIPRLSKDKQCERPFRSHVLSQLIMNLIETSDSLDDETTNYRKGTIWVAEDNIVNQKVIVGMMRHLDMQCEVFSDGAGIVQAFRERPADPDLVLMDCEMPIKDGYDATREIRELEREKKLPRLPIIALTAHLGEEFSQMARDSGMDDLINKPVRKQTLRKTFAIWLPVH